MLKQGSMRLILSFRVYYRQPVLNKLLISSLPFFILFSMNQFLLQSISFISVLLHFSTTLLPCASALNYVHTCIRTGLMLPFQYVYILILISTYTFSPCHLLTSADPLEQTIATSFFPQTVIISFRKVFIFSFQKSLLFSHQPIVFSGTIRLRWAALKWFQVPSPESSWLPILAISSYCRNSAETSLKGKPQQETACCLIQLRCLITLELMSMLLTFFTIQSQRYLIRNFWAGFRQLSNFPA